MKSLEVVTEREQKLCTISADFSDATVRDLKIQVSQKTNIPLSRLSIRLEARGKNLSDDLPLTVLANSIPKVYAKDLGPQIGWRTVFLFEYCGALIIYGLMFLKPSFFYNAEMLENHTGDKHNSLPFILWSSHFIKRILETLFIHRFSHSTMPVKNLFKNCGYYWGFAALIGYHVNHPFYTPVASKAIQVTGTWIFVFCEFGNLSTHLVLRDLRPSGTKKRGIPYPNRNPLTFLFRFVSCPNYTYEFGAWVGFSMVVNCIYVGIFMFIGFIQMTIWALEKHHRYISEFADYPKNRYVIVPILV